MGRLRRIRAANGTIVPFRQTRIAATIRAAAEVAGMGDATLADELAGVVTLFLEKRFDDDRPPTVDDVRTMVAKVLIETGHVRIANAHRRLSVEVQGEDGAGADLPSAALAAVPESTEIPPLRVEVVRLPEGLPMPFERERLIQSLKGSGRIDAGDAADLVADVEARLRRSGRRRITTSLLQEIVDTCLLERGEGVAPVRAQLLGVSRSDVESWMDSTQSTVLDPEEESARTVLGTFSLEEVHSPAVAEAHIEGRIHILGLGAPQRVERVVIDATGPLLRTPRGLDDFLLELTTLLQAVRPLVRRRVVIDGFSEAFAQATRRISKKAAGRFVEDLLDHLTKVDVFGRPVFPPVTLGIHLTGDHLESTGLPDDAARVRLLADVLLDRLEARPALAERLSLELRLSARAPYRWPDGDSLGRLLRVARRHRGVALRLLREDEEARAGGRSAAPDRVLLDVGACAVNVPQALALAAPQSLGEIANALTGAFEIAVTALYEKYWFLRRSAPETLRGMISRLPGGRDLQIEGAGQGGQLLLWGLPQAIALLIRQGLVTRADGPSIIARILSCADYVAGEDRDGMRLRISIGGLRERRAQERLLASAEDLAARIDGRHFARSLESDEAEGGGLPLASPILSPDNDPVLRGRFLTRLGAGLPLPARGEDEVAGGYWLSRLFESTALGYFELEERPEVIEVQEGLFG